MTNISSVITDDGKVSPLDAFTGVIVSAKSAFFYKLGLAVVAFAMVLLPAIYVALIVLTAWGVFYHLTRDTWLFNGSTVIIYRLLLYFGPAVVGGILVFFMVKPFLAHPANNESERITLDPAKEPLLFQFVERICELMKAARPSRIDVDCLVNASARLRHGFWSKDLVLTIGLPLVAGLDMRQFGGVLAHEFGHFTQGVGMRLTYLIRKINFWFYRVVYERDNWDATLDKTARQADFRVKLVLEAARGCVWLSRRSLWVLMNIGHGISCFMLRQMEYDADSYEAKLVGSDTFESTMARLPLLSFTMQSAWEDVRRTWSNGRLAENLPMLMGHKSNLVPDDVHRQLATTRAAAETGWFYTHPCDKDRIRAARKLNEPGIFRLTQPAADLFADFNALSKTMTRHCYEKQFGLKFDEKNLIPTEDVLRESAAAVEAEAVGRKFYGDMNPSLKAPLVKDEWLAAISQQAMIAEWREKRKACEELREQAERISKAWKAEDVRLVDAIAVQYLGKARFTVPATDFGLPESATTIAAQASAAKSVENEVRTTLALQLAALDPFFAALRGRVTLALANARVMRPETAGEIETFALLLIAVSAEMPAIYEAMLKLHALNLLAQNRENSPNRTQFDQVVAELTSDLRPVIGGIQDRLRKFSYPFPHSQGPLSVADYLRSEKPATSENQRVYLDAGTLADGCFSLHYRLLLKLLQHADATEKVLEAQDGAGSA